MDKETMIGKLNDCLRHEWTGVAQYAQAGFVVGGLWRQVYSGLFFGSAEESFGHAKLVGDKISAMGSIPTVERNPIQQSTDVRELLELGLEFESKAVTHYARSHWYGGRIGRPGLGGFAGRHPEGRAGRCGRADAATARARSGWRQQCRLKRWLSGRLPN